MRKNTILLSFDVEEFDLPLEYGAPVSEQEKYAVSGDGMARVLEVIEEKKIAATYFVTANFAEHFPELVARMTASGGEIASHGRDHSKFETADLAYSRTVLEKLSGRTVTGFRMARLAPVKKEEILAAGYEYESSLNPVWLPGRYNHFTAPLLPFRESCGLMQYPVSAVPFVRFPLFWLSFKTLHAGFYRWLARRTLRHTGYFNLYTHPWEYNEAARDAKWRIPKYITNHAGGAMADRLGRLIDALKPDGVFRTFRETL